MSIIYVHFSRTCFMAAISTNINSTGIQRLIYVTNKRNWDITHNRLAFLLHVLL